MSSEKIKSFFVHVGESLASVIPQCTKVPSDYLKLDTVNKMYLDPVTENEIDKIFLNFRDSSAGWDELKPTVDKSIRYCIKSRIRHICNLSFRTGIFPDELKIANVVPIFKSGDEMIFSNYRPVSVLPVFSKTIERLMYNRFLKFINDKDLLYKYQFGISKGEINSHGFDNTDWYDIWSIRKCWLRYCDFPCLFNGLWYCWPHYIITKTIFLWQTGCYAIMVWKSFV